MTETLRPESDIAIEIGQQVIDAADSLRLFAPDCQARVLFKIDGMGFEAVVRGAPSKDRKGLR